MKSNIKKMLVKSLIFFIAVKILLLILSLLRYEFILFGLTMWHIQDILFCFVLMLALTLAVFRQFEKKRKKIVKVLSFLAAVIFMLAGFEEVAFSRQLLYYNVQFNELEISGDICHKVIVAGEHSMIGGTCGALYERINVWLLRRLDNVNYHADNGYFPVASKEYHAEYSAKNNQLYFQYKFNEDSDVVQYSYELP